MLKKVFLIPQVRNTIGVFILLMITPFYLVNAQSYTKLKDLHRNNFVSFDSIINNSDSIKTSRDSLPRVEKKFRMTKSPLLAVMLSVVVPGAGQLYNESYWKIPIIDGLIVYFGYEYFDNNKKFKDYRDQYNATITAENPSGNLNLKSLREFYRSQRDDFVWYFIIVYTVNLIDAYVDAHLFDFDVKEEKYTQYGNAGKTYRLKLNINF